MPSQKSKLDLGQNQYVMGEYLYCWLWALDNKNSDRNNIRTGLKPIDYNKPRD